MENSFWCFIVIIGFMFLPLAVMVMVDLLFGVSIPKSYQDTLYYDLTAKEREAQNEKR